MTSLADIKQQLTTMRAGLSSPEAALVDLFIKRISNWSTDDSTIEELVANLDRTLGNIWFSTNEAHATVALVIARLRDTVAAIGGMTMNERLDYFDLMDRWDQTPDSERDVLYKKLCAKR
jgi:hypothetical protein